jgi:hypothetical protein
MHSNVFYVVEISKFVSNFQFLVNNNQINKNMITRHDKGIEVNLHSKLIYVVLNSVNEKKHIALPEIKLRLTNPLENQKIKKRKQWNYKADVVVYENNKYNIIDEICEVFGLDMCGNYITMEERDEIHKLSQLTSADKIIHLFKDPRWNSKIDFCLVGVLPKKIEQKPSYAEVKKMLEGIDNLYDHFKPQIEQLFSKLNKKVVNDCHSIIVAEDGIYYDSVLNKITF